ncbi:MAG: diguanylate cyclase, partial [Deltaproteobacteria bacterium]|nr:diguanylate cyclase [Deltaproteobacteria bacterium]
KKVGVKIAVDVAYSLFQEYDNRAKNGELSLEDAKRRLIQRIKNMRYDDKEYLWINDMKPSMIMHPIKPELDGTDLSGNKDPNGKYIFRMFVEVCRRQDAGFVEYMWPKPGEDKPIPKISYVKRYEPWGWIVGSGLYIDDVRKDVRRSRFYMLAGTFIFTIVTISLAVMIGTGITRPLKKVISGLQDIASGKGGTDLSKRIAITSIDEIGLLSTEFNSLMESINSHSVFKKVIEEEDSLEEVYQRLGGMFTQKLGISRCFIYQVSSAQNTLELIFPSSFDHAEMLCNLDILDHGELCKARRTGHLINSATFSDICRQFNTPNEFVHYCIPAVVGGDTVAIVQFVFEKPDSSAGVKAMEAKVFKAEQYIVESLPVIETKRLMGSLRDMALIDPLTGLNNRRYLQEYTEKIVAGILRRGKTVGLIMCDLDYFKQVNDTYGHNAGDIVLKQTAAAIKKCVRDSDIVIRFGGEEFLVVLLDILEGESMKVAEKIRLTTEQLKIKIPDGMIHKTISLGISEFPGDGDTFWSCIKFADVALYRAKEEGRNRSVRFTSDMWTEEEV